MRVVLRGADGEVDVEVAVHDPAATVADLVAALPGGSAGRAGLVIDGAPVPGATALRASGLRPGSEVAVDGAPAGGSAEPPPPSVVDAELLVVGGMAAGARQRLGPGRSVLGRDPACAVVLPTRTTSGRHAVLTVETGERVSLADAGSTSGTWVDGRRVQGVERLLPGAVAALGAALVRVGAPVWREPAVLGPPDPEGRRPLHRPPPQPPHPPPAPVAPPPDQPLRGEAPRFGWAAALVPLVGGLVLARLVDPRLALFTLLGPAVLIGQWLEDRRRHRRRGADIAVARRADLASFAAALQTAGAHEAGRRHASHPDPAELGAEIESAGSALWSRRPGHPAFAEVAVGAAPALAWAAPTTTPTAGPGAAVLAGAHLPHGCPATVALSPGSHLGIAGARPAALAAARWAVLQLAAHHGPADLSLAVLCGADRAQDWRWAAFLPHTAAPGGAGRRLLAAGPGEAADVADLCPAGPGSHLVVVVDGEGLLETGRPAATLLGGTVATLTVASSRRALPGRCTTVLELDGPDGWGRLAAGTAAAQALLATGVDHDHARRWACGLAGFSDPEAAGAGATPPAATRLLDLLGVDVPTADAVRRRWAGPGRTATPIGCTGGPDGFQPVHLDLVADGPHALVAGTTGAGKSELLRSLVAGLAATSPPDRLALLLVDYKGGAAFAEAALLPHVLGVVTDLGPEEAARALHSLEAELRRREGVLAELGLRDLAQHPAHGPDPPPPGLAPLPRLVVVVDELAALAAELPSFLDDLVQLAARGRSLGLHLVLATQRPGSVVSAAVRTNCAIRCCLRVPDEADAVDVVGSPAPARLDRRQPGRAFLRRGAGDLVEVQVAMVGGSRPAPPGPVTVRPATFGPHPAPAPPPPAEMAGAGQLAALVAACRRAAADAALPLPAPLWLPPLPATLAASDLPPGGDEVVLGLVDDPARQRRLPLGWSPRQGPLVAVGTGPGPAQALQAVARVLAARCSPGQLHVYGLDLAARGLATLGGLPHVGGLVGPGEHERLHRLVRRLGDELARRQAAAGEVGHAAGGPVPLVLVLVDGVAGLAGALGGAGAIAALDTLERVMVDGAALGLVAAVAADRPAALPGAWNAAASRRLAFRSGDPLDLFALGAGRLDQSAWPDGRCLDLTSGLVAQVATGGWPGPAGPGPADAGCGPAPILTLPDSVALSEVLATCRPSAGRHGLRLPLGIDGSSLAVAVARLRPGQPFLICGPPGAGRTTALAAVAVAAAAAGCDVVDADSGLCGRLAAHAATGQPDQPLVVLVDDAPGVADPGGALADLVAGRHPAAHLVATAPPEAVRGGFGHWSAELRRAPSGLVLRPRSDLDADVLGVPVLPRWAVPLAAPGRGVLVVEGEAVPVQVAIP